METNKNEFTNNIMGECNKLSKTDQTAYKGTPMNTTVSYDWDYKGGRGRSLCHMSGPRMEWCDQRYTVLITE
ncbi:hypothetical protein E2C01_079422 [Portunus trituberculatus]|uniref:Uncharacterized protein n=1 Tax=Portunus trituberculatus TaxID=210409 RepID=A0A5B7ITC0_PORTR|nr:hypothetical protein [Portunus trituberculatus]